MINKEVLSPGILQVLPMLYVGWSDSVLSNEEFVVIHKKINELKFLDSTEKNYLIKHCNPQLPPNASVFKYWLDTFKYYAAQVSLHDKKSLSAVGIEMAKYSLNGSSIDNKDTYQALLDIEQSLGLDNQKDLNLLLHQLGYDATFEYASFANNKVDRLTSILDGKYSEIKSKLRNELVHEDFKIKTFNNKEEHRSKVLLNLKKLASKGYGAYSFPKEFGGKDNKGEHIAIFEMLAYQDMSLMVKFGVQFGLFGGAIYGLGSEYHHNLYLKKLGNAELLGCFAMTEYGHGSNVKSIKTTGIYDESSHQIIINTPSDDARKEYIGNALDGEMAVVFLQLIVKDVNHGVHAVLVNLKNENKSLNEGIKVEDLGYKIGLNGVDNGRIWFDNVRVPVHNLLNKYGGIDEKGEYYSSIKSDSKRFFTMLGALVAGRISVGIAGNNAAKKALNLAIHYAFKRKQFGRSDDEEQLIIDYPTHQRRLFPKLAKSIAFTFALNNLVNEYSNSDEEDQRKIETKAAVLKSLASWHGVETIQECREACGGNGYITANQFDALKADADIFTTFEGDNYVLLQLVAKSLLTEFKQSFHDEGFKAVIRFLGSKMRNTIAEINPYYARMTSTEHLLDRDFHLHAFRYREKKTLLSLASRMQEYLKKRINPYDAFLMVQNHMVDLAIANGERLTLRYFVQAIDKIENDEDKVLLNKVCVLYALSIIEREKGFFLETGYMEGSKTKSIRRMVTQLCEEIKPNVLLLVNSFGIPTSLLKTEMNSYKSAN